MSFVSIQFLIFVIIALFIYYIVPKKCQWCMLLVFSYIFYLFTGYKTLAFILFTTVITFFVGKYFGKVNEKYEAYLSLNTQLNKKEKKAVKEKFNKQKKGFLIIVLLLNFGILFILKYFNVVEGIGDLIAEIFHINNSLKGISLVLPLGISFYTFQSMGYMIDLYRNKYKPETNLAKYALFISFFPQLVQGPISRFDELANQLFEKRSFDYKVVKYGLQLMLWGYFKKMIIADRIAIITNTIMGEPSKYSGFYIVFASAFSWIELYMDFSGGIDVARGVAQLFGVYLPENFKQPLFAESIADFWRRWHISLNNWWRDYIFYPMTLSKRFSSLGKTCKKLMGNDVGKKIPVVIAMLIVRVINGIWHGANSIYIIGGLYHGIIMGASFLFEKQLLSINKKLRINTECFSWKLFRILRTYFIITIPRVIAKASNWQGAKESIKYMFSDFNPWVLFDDSLYTLGVNQKEWYVVLLALLIVLIVSVIREKGFSVRECLDKQNAYFRWCLYTIAIVMIILFGVYGVGYDSSNFQYANF